jgi:hypothetical protein
MFGILVGGLALAAHSESIPIGTGLDASGNPLSSFSFEQNYAVGGNAAQAVVYTIGSPWLDNVANGQWITPYANGGFDWGSGLDTYTRTIDGIGSMSGMFATDNPGELLVNGVAVATTPGWPGTDLTDYSYWTYFNNIILNQPVNTIEFEVINLSGPTGLIVAGTATVNVPDAGLTAMLFAMGLVGLGAIRRKLG